MPSLLQTTINSMLIRGTANLVAQLSQPRPKGLDYFRILQFVIFGLISAPINTHWQHYLEEKFPTKMSAPDSDTKRLNQNDRSFAKNTAGESSISWLNVAIKLALDQTLGLFVLNVIFLTIMNIEHIDEPETLLLAVQNRIFPILRAGWKIWPLVALTNFIFVPVDQRVLLISCVGFGWNIFLSFLEK